MAFTIAGNRFYFAVREGVRTLIYEGVPTTAAGVASVSLLASIEDIWAYDILYVGGLLYIGTMDGSIYYIRPGAEYGLLLHPQIAHDLVEHDHGATRTAFDRFAFEEFYVYGTALDISSRREGSVYQMDRVTGAWQILSVFDGTETDVAGDYSTAAASHRDLHSLVLGNYLLTAAKADLSSVGKWALSPWHNFGVLEEKQLLAIKVQHNMPTTWSLKIYARKNGDDDSETLIGTITGTGSATTTTVTPSSSGFEFNQISLRLAFEESGAAATDIPYVYSVETRATVVQPQKVWRLLLDCADDGTGVHEGTSGTTKISNVRSAGNTGTPVEFKNGYGDRRIGQSSTHTVVVDSYQINQDRAGEGVAFVVLREVA